MGILKNGTVPSSPVSTNESEPINDSDNEKKSEETKYPLATAPTVALVPPPSINNDNLIRIANGNSGTNYD